MKKSMLCAGLMTILSTTVYAEVGGKPMNAKVKQTPAIHANKQIKHKSAHSATATRAPKAVHHRAQTLASNKVKTPAPKGEQKNTSANVTDTEDQKPSTYNQPPSANTTTPGADQSMPAPDLPSSLNKGVPSSALDPRSPATDGKTISTVGKIATFASAAAPTTSTTTTTTGATTTTTTPAATTGTPPATNTTAPSTETTTPVSTTPTTAPSTTTTTTTTPVPQTPAPGAAPAGTSTTPSSGAPATVTPTPVSTPASPQPLNCTYRIPAETTHIEQTIVMKWAEKAAEQSFDFDHNNIDNQLAALKSCYTEQGWAGFNDALQKSGNLNAIKSQQLTVSSMVNGESKVTEIKENQWKVIIPMQVVYQNEKEKLTQPLTINLVVGRKISGDLGIMQMIAIPTQTTTPNAGTVAPQTNPATAPAPMPNQPSTPTPKQP